MSVPVRRAAAAPRVRRKYRNPAITEAVCEFRFLAGKEWDWTIPGLIYGKIKEEFPHKQQENSLEVTISPKEAVVTQQVTGTLSKMQFLKADRSAMVQVGPDLLAVNLYRPYPDWERFEALISQNLAIYRAEANPKGVARIGLRYINKFQFSSADIELMDFFNFYTHIADAVEQRHGPFAMRVMFFYSNGRDALNVRMGHTQSEDPRNLAIALDLDYYLAKPREAKLDEAMEWVRLAHDNLEEMFEACITDRTRELCGVEGSNK